MAAIHDITSSATKAAAGNLTLLRKRGLATLRWGAVRAMQLFAGLAVWHLLVRALDVDPRVVPLPWDVLVSLHAQVASGWIFGALWLTLQETLIGFVIGQQFDGTVGPVALGYLVCGLLALIAVLFAEKGRLFRAHHAGQGGSDAVAFH